MSPEHTGPGTPTPASLADRQAISDVVLTYCRGIDRLDRDLVTSCFHADATDTHGSFNGTIAEFIDWAFALLQRYDSTMHLVANHLATVNGSAAVAETYGIAYHRSSDPDPRRNLTVGFRYLDRLERRDEGPWRIARRIATTTRKNRAKCRTKSGIGSNSAPMPWLQSLCMPWKVRAQKPATGLAFQPMLQRF